MVKGVPNREPEAYAEKLRRYDSALKIISLISVIIVFGGSVYGFYRMVHSQTNWSATASMILALMICGVLIALNSAAVSFSMRGIAAICNLKHVKNNIHQKFGGIDWFLMFVGLCMTASIMYADMTANGIGNDHAAKSIISKPEEGRVDSTAHTTVMAMAEKGLAAEKAAEAKERQAHNVEVDRKINDRIRFLKNRRAKIAPYNWGQPEVKLIDNELAGIEAKRRDQKNAFAPKKADVAAKQRELAQIALVQGKGMAAKAAIRDSIFVFEAGDYLENTKNIKLSFFWIYLMALLVWHVCDFIYHNLSMRYDVEDTDQDDNMLESFKEAMTDFLKNSILYVLKAFKFVTPEKPVIVKKGTKRAKAIVQSTLSLPLFECVHNHPGINEDALLMKLTQEGVIVFTNGRMLARNKDLSDFHKTLDLLIQSNIVKRVGDALCTNPEQAKHFFGEIPEKKTPKSASFSGENPTFTVGNDDLKAKIAQIISDFKLLLPVLPSQEAQQAQNYIDDFSLIHDTL
jgi:hypothetical protein